MKCRDLEGGFQAASKGGYIQVVERLLEAGADVNAAAAAFSGGCTALQAASDKPSLLLLVNSCRARLFTAIPG
jgi:hypothetical protein